MRLVKVAVARRPEYRDVRLDFTFQVCVPIDQLEEEMTRTGFEQCLALAEEVEHDLPSAPDGRVVLDLAARLESKAKYDRKGGRNPADQFNREDMDARVFMVPESIASMAAYVVSLEKEFKIHAIIDFGAGTTDVSIVHISEAGSAGHSADWYAARNLPTGAGRIEDKIADYWRLRGQVLTHSLLNEVWRNADLRLMSPEDELRCLWEKTLPVWREAYAHLRQQMEWAPKNVRVFTTGGASQMHGIERVFSRCWNWNAGNWNWWYPVGSLPIPGDYRKQNSDIPFYRVSVAYGLTKPLPTLGLFRLPHQVGDLTQPPPAVTIPLIGDPDWINRWNWP